MALFLSKKVLSSHYPIEKKASSSLDPEQPIYLLYKKSLVLAELYRLL